MKIDVDEWIAGEGTGSGREFLVRTRAPRCVVAVDEPGETVLAPIVYVNDYGEGFYVELWMDPEPPKAAHEAILKEAAQALDAFTERAARANEEDEGQD